MGPVEAGEPPSRPKAQVLASPRAQVLMNYLIRCVFVSCRVYFQNSLCWEAGGFRPLGPLIRNEKIQGWFRERAASCCRPRPFPRISPGSKKRWSWTFRDIDSWRPEDALPPHCDFPDVFMARRGSEIREWAFPIHTSNSSPKHSDPSAGGTTLTWEAG